MKKILMILAVVFTATALASCSTTPAPKKTVLDKNKQIFEKCMKDSGFKRDDFLSEMQVKNGERTFITALSLKKLEIKSEVKKANACAVKAGINAKFGFRG
ncbi:MAG: hypothetical protein HRU29_11960 [Rhizobiales bacterium]|nr:hypothetical protein [Hyphomicrobiales bacterium]NRB15104.1 hypothetical protein [Hyphomicrobiales bacterium]